MTPLMAPVRSSKYPQFEEGVNAATVTAVNDLGMVTRNKFQSTEQETIPMVELVFTGENGKTAKKKYKFSSHPKAGLFEAVKGIIGKEPGAKFDYNTLIGRNVTLVIVENGFKGAIYGNIDSITKPQSGQKTYAAASETTTGTSTEIADDDIPF